jgi:hypothetical protein
MADDPLTAELTALKLAEEAASPRPWRLVLESCDCGGGMSCGHPDYVYAIVTAAAHTTDPGPRQAEDYEHTCVDQIPVEDAQFMIAARTALPWLLSAVNAVLKLADDARVIMHGSPPPDDLTRAVGDPIAWNLDPAAVREALTRALTGEATDA